MNKGRTSLRLPFQKERLPPCWLATLLCIESINAFHDISPWIFHRAVFTTSRHFSNERRVIFSKDDHHPKALYFYVESLKPLVKEREIGISNFVYAQISLFFGRSDFSPSQKVCMLVFIMISPQKSFPVFFNFFTSAIGLLWTPRVDKWKG